MEGLVSLEHQTFGRHLIVDAWGIDFDKINDLRLLKYHLERAATICGATVLSVKGHAFEPFGVTVIVVLSESHLSIHTYPEKGFAAIDGYTCGNIIDPKDAIDYILTILEPKKVYAKKVIRGIREPIIQYVYDDC